MSDLKYLIIQVGQQCARSMKANFTSLSRQRFKNWKLIFVDDGSKDETQKEVKRLIQLYGLSDQVKLKHFPEKKGLLFHVWEVIQDRSAEFTHLLVMTGKHRFARDQAFEKLIKSHEQGWGIVWAKWRDRNNMIFQCGALHAYEPIRQQPWVFSGPLSVDKKYLQNISKQDLLDNNEEKSFFIEGGLQALGYITCENTIKRRFLNEVLFTYDEQQPIPYDSEGMWQDEWMPKELRETIHALADREPKEIRVDQPFFNQHLYAFTEMAFLAERQLSRMELAKAQISPGASSTKVQKVKDLELESEIANQLLPTEEEAELTPEENFNRLLTMDIEDAEMMAEAGLNQEALEIFLELAEHELENARIHTNIGVLHWSLENTKEGLKHFILAMKFDRDNRNPVMNCAGAWVELGRLDLATKLCTEFLERHPGDQAVYQLLKELETLAS